MCKNDGTPAAMKSGKGDTTMATFVRHILRGGNEVGDTSQKNYATSGQGPHVGGIPAFKADVGHCTGTTLRAINRRCGILQV